MWELDYKESWELKNWCFSTVVLEQTPGSPLDCKEIQPVHPKGYQSWVFIGRTEAEAPLLWRISTWREELTHWKKPWCCKRLLPGGETGNRGWDGWTASLTQWAWVWASSRSWQWRRKPGVLQSLESQRVGHDWATELNWTEWSSGFPYFCQFQSVFSNNKFMVWAKVSSWSCFYWLYKASPPLAAKNIINLISVLTIWWCSCVEQSLVLLEEGVCYDQ